jgi:glutamine synthetase
MHGYSMLRPSLNQDYFYSLFDSCHKFRVPVEGLHTETGPGVFEVALAFDGTIFRCFASKYD